MMLVGGDWADRSSSPPPDAVDGMRATTPASRSRRQGMARSLGFERSTRGKAADRSRWITRSSPTRSWSRWRRSSRRRPSGRSRRSNRPFRPVLPANRPAEVSSHLVTEQDRSGGEGEPSGTADGSQDLVCGMEGDSEPAVGGERIRPHPNLHRRDPRPFRREEDPKQRPGHPADPSGRSLTPTPANPVLRARSFVAMSDPPNVRLGGGLHGGASEVLESDDHPGLRHRRVVLHDPPPAESDQASLNAVGGGEPQGFAGLANLVPERGLLTRHRRPLEELAEGNHVLQ